MFITGLFLGLFFGAAVGILAYSLCVASKLNIGYGNCEHCDIKNGGDTACCLDCQEGAKK